MAPWLRQLLIAVSIIVLAWLIGRIALYVLNLLQKRLAERTSTILDDVVLEAIKSPLQVLIFMAGIELALLGSGLLSIEGTQLITRIFFTLYYILVYITAYRLIGGMVRWYAQEMVHRTETDIDDRFLFLFRNIAYVVLTLIVIAIILGRYGIEVSALVTTLGITSLAVALAAKETLSDVFSGFAILVDQPFKKGDRIEILDIRTWGDVVEVGLRSTRILTRDNRLVIVPNSVIGKGLVVNHSNPTTNYRIQTHLSMAYGTDIEVARQVIVDALKQQDWVLPERSIDVLFLEFRENALYFRVRCWIEDYSGTRRSMDKLNSTLYKALTNAGIEMATVKRDLKITAVKSIKANGIS